MGGGWPGWLEKMAGMDPLTLQTLDTLPAAPGERVWARLPPTRTPRAERRRQESLLHSIGATYDAAANAWELTIPHLRFVELRYLLERTPIRLYRTTDPATSSQP